MDSGIELRLNGESRSFPSGTTLIGILAALELDPERVAIELDRAIVKREKWADASLKNGSEIEIVQFVGGG